jgi:hypothetical protein
MQIKPALLAACLAIASSAVHAQPKSSANCTPTQTDPQQGTLTPNGTKNAEPLSDKLAKSDGVLCPPGGVDTDMHVPTPNAGTTPVIPPPGSPGGDQSVRPK